MRRRSARPRWAIRSLLAATALLLSGCAQDWPLNPLAPQGPIAERQAELFWLVFWIAAIVFVLVEGALVYILLRFRARRDDTTLPRQVHGNMPLEIIWTLIPAVLLAVLAVPTVQTIFALNRGPAGDPMEVKVIGHQWWWEFQYPEEEVTTANELVIPTGRPVRLMMSSADVIHSFWPARLAGKQDVIPGRENPLWIIAPEPGRYFGQCAEFCGASHANMRFRVVATSPSDFSTWVTEQKADARSPVAADAAEGARLFQEGGEKSTQSCAACHAIRGTKALARVGPELTHLMSRTIFAGGMFELNEANLQAWLRDPPTAKPGSKMPDLDLSEPEIRALVAYLQTLE